MRTYTEEEIKIMSDSSLTGADICKKLNISTATLARARRRLGISVPSGLKPGQGPKKNGIYKPCPKCGKDVYHTKKYLDKQKYCSRTCMYSSEEFREKMRSIDRSALYEKMRGKIKNPNIKQYRRYANAVHRLSAKVYKDNIDIINPERHPRTVCGIDGGWQLDHIVSIKECFENGISPEEASALENLRMLPWKENLMRNYEHNIQENNVS